jgi:hypothetical protein
MSMRKPIVAGSFYPSSRPQCEQAVDSCLVAAKRSAARIEHRAIGGVVPHAGYVCSGAVGAATFEAIRNTRKPKTFVLFGAVHTPTNALAAMDSCSAWETPMGTIEVDGELAAEVLRECDLITSDSGPHEREHSLEVQIPLIQKLYPGVKILPIVVRPTDRASQIGRQVAEAAESSEKDVVFIASSDLTHYGPRYGFTPKGVGDEGLRWAHGVNDLRVIDLISRLDADEVVREAAVHHNACGSGAIAATIAASRMLGATRGELVWRTSSSEVLEDQYGPMDDSVGYAGMILS